MAFTAARDRHPTSIRLSGRDLTGLVALLLIAVIFVMPSSWREAALNLIMPQPATAEVALTTGALFSGAVAVVDGDTLDLDGRRIRLHGVDAFERDQICGSGASAWPCGQIAAQTLERRLDGRSVTCEPLDTDRYGRTVARCRTGGEDVAAFLVDRGLAVAYRRYSDDYVAAEDHARAAGIGVWRDPAFTSPEDWRIGR